MGRFFVPYQGKSPAAIEIKGHRLLFVAASEDDLAQNEQLLGSDTVREFYLLDTEEAETLTSLAKEVKGGIVLAPSGMSLSSMIINLENDLPWVH
jgi:hypothetical protein